MLGKRSRSILRFTGVVSMGLECSPADNIALSEQFTERQNSLPCAPRQVVGFELKPSSDNEEHKKPFPLTLTTEKQSGSPKSFPPTSGLEGLLSSPRPPGKENKNLQPVGLSFVATLDTSIDVRCEGKYFATECHSKAPGVALRCMAHIYETKKTYCCAYANTCKKSNPIPIIQSSIPEPAAPRRSKHQIPNQSYCQDSLQCVPRASSISDEMVYSDVHVRKCIFNLLTASPGTHEGAEYVSFFSMDFMEACFLCHRQLGQGRDIYMYRGDKAFCSVECRHQQIVSDELAERSGKCSSVALRAGTSVQSHYRNQRPKVLVAGAVVAA